MKLFRGLKQNLYFGWRLARQGQVLSFPLAGLGFGFAFEYFGLVELMPLEWIGLGFGFGFGFRKAKPPLAQLRGFAD